MARPYGLVMVAAWSLLAPTLLAGPFAPAAGLPGSDAVLHSDSRFVAWATSVVSLTRGPRTIADPSLGVASFGAPGNALGPAGIDPTHVVSLGDGGSITLAFDQPITNGPGFDFAVFENAFADVFLELAFVEVSSNGVDFYRFPSTSLTPVAAQIDSFGSIDPTNIDNLAGKHRSGFGTPFDLDDIQVDSIAFDASRVRYVRIIDVVGSIDPLFATTDSVGSVINDPWPTVFASGGFDLDGVGVIHAIPEAPSVILMALVIGAGIFYRLAATRSVPVYSCFDRCT